MKRRELEAELRKLEGERRDTEFRLRSITMNPRNRRLIAGDFSRPPRRDLRRPRDEDESGESSKKPRLNVELRKKDDEDDKDKEDTASKDTNKDVEEPTASDNKDEDKENPEESKDAENADKPKRTMRTSKGGEVRKRDLRMFGFLKGHLGKAKTRLSKDQDTEAIKKQKEVDEKVKDKVSNFSVHILEKESQLLISQQKEEKAARESIIRKEEALRRELDELIIVEHHESLGNYILTTTSPNLYFLPASHTEKTKNLLAKAKKAQEKSLEDTPLILEKDLDQGYIDALFVEKERKQEKEETAEDKDSKMNDDDDSLKKPSSKTTEKKASESESDSSGSDN